MANTNYDVTAVCNAIQSARRASANCWGMAVETADDEAAAEVFEGRADLCDGYYEDALELAQDGKLEGVHEPLECARRIEAECGDDSHARGAIAVLTERSAVDRILASLTAHTIFLFSAEAAEAGDLMAVEVCDAALAGDPAARRSVAHMIADAGAQS